MTKRIPFGLFAFVASCSVLLAQGTELPTIEACEEECRDLLRDLEASRGAEGKATGTIASRKTTLVAWSNAYPHSPIIRYVTGMAYLSVEDVEGALPHLKDAYVVSDRHVSIGPTYSLALKMAKQPEESLAVAKQLVDENQDRRDLRYSYALQLKMMQQYETAIAHFQHFLESTRNALDRASALGNIGECKLYLGEHGEAIELLVKAHEGNPDGRALANLAEAYVKTRQFGKAKDAIRELLNMTTNHPRTLFLTAVILESEGRPQKSRTYYKRAYQVATGSLVEDSGSENYLLSQICEKLGKNAESLAYKSEAKKLHFTYEAPWSEAR